MKIFLRIFILSTSFFLVILCFFINPQKIDANSLGSDVKNARVFKRSIESLRDLDYQTWQVIVYSKSDIKNNLVLRIVGFPGDLRIDHPTNLIVTSGRRDWELNDMTLDNKSLIKDSKESALEFDISPLISDLDKNRPLRLYLPGVINDLPIPPYLVNEWREVSVLDSNEPN